MKAYLKMRMASATTSNAIKCHSNHILIFIKFLSERSTNHLKHYETCYFHKFVERPVDEIHEKPSIARKRNREIYLTKFFYIIENIKFAIELRLRTGFRLVNIDKK